MKEPFYLRMVFLGVASSAPARSLPPVQPVPKDIWAGDTVLSRGKNTIIFSVCNIYFEGRPHAAVYKLIYWEN
jgi:hypothetical protein